MRPVLNEGGGIHSFPAALSRCCVRSEEVRQGSAKGGLVQGFESSVQFVGAMMVPVRRKLYGQLSPARYQHCRNFLL